MTEQDMSTNPEASQTPEPGRLRKAFRWTVISFGGLLAALVLIILVVVAFSIPIELDWVKGKIETSASEALGRPFAIEGPLTLVPSMPPAAQIEGVRIGNPKGWPEADLARLDLARAELRILPLLKGEVLIEEISVEGLQVSLETNAEGESNWLLKKSDEAPTPEPEEEREPPALKFIELAELSLRDIVLTHRDAAIDKTFELELKEITGSAEDLEPMRLLIQGTVQDVPYEVNFSGGSLASLVADKASWPLDVSATAVGAKLTIGGEIAQPLRGRGLALDFDLTGPRMKDLEVILGTRLPPIQSFGLQGRIEEADGKYRIADLKGEIATTGVTGSFEADISGARPRLQGDIDIQSIDAGPFFAAIGEEEKVQAEGAPQPEQSDRALPEEEVAEPAKKVDVDEPVLTLEPLERFDAQLKVTIHEVVNAPMTLRDASLQVSVADGKLAAPMALTLAEVPFNGELSLAPENGQPKVSISLAGEKSDIGELARFLSGAKGIEGKFDLARLDLSAGGETIRSLVETAELRVAMAGASLSYGHETGGRPVEFTLEEASLLFPAADESQITARGSLLGEAFSLELKGGTFIENLVQKRWPLELSATGGGAKLRIGGTVRQAEGDRGSELDFAFTGEQIGSLAAWLGVSPEASQSYALSGKATHREAELRIQLDEVRIGESAFAGEAGVRREGDTPVTFAKLDFDVLDLKGLGSLFPEKPEKEEPESVPQKSGPETLTIDVPILPKGIEIFDSDIEIAVARIKLDPADITEVAVSSRIRDGFVEKAPIGAVIAGARFEGNFGVDLRGEVPKIDLEIGSSKVDVGSLLAQLGVADGLAMTAGGFDLDLAMEGASTREILERSAFSVGIKDGLWRLRAPGAKEGLDIRVPEAAISAEPEQPIRLAIDGRIDKTPVKIDITTDPLASFAEPKERLKMDVGVALAKVSLKLTGAAPLPVQAENLHLAMDLSGKRFSDFDELLDVSLPPIGPYRLRGEFGSRKSGYYVKNLRATVGKSTLTGKLDLKTAQRPPRLDVDLVAKRIQLDDFDTGDWSAAGDGVKSTEKPEASESEPRAPAGGRSLLSPAVIRSLNGKVRIQVDEVLSGQDHLGRGVLTATLEGGRASIDPLTLNVPGGSVDVSFALEPTERDVALEASAKIEKLDYGILARRIDPKSKTGGVISLDVDLKTRGPDLKRVMQGSNGHIDFGLWPKDLNAGIFDLWAVNVISALMTEVDKDKASKVNCVIARFRVDDGLMRERVVFADTSKMRVEGSAEIDFNQRTLDVRAAPKAKKPEFFSLAVPVGLSGDFEDFGIKVNPVVLGGKAISFVTSPLHVPLRRIFRKGEPEDGEQACAEAWRVRDLSEQASGVEQDPERGEQGSTPSRNREAGQRVAVPERDSTQDKPEKNEQDSSLDTFQAE
ncbi:MAG: AsmA family protein [Pseudomonadota bacterium]|nr:AsmA family protein [Pseudomonadota bacterium]